MYCFKGSEVAKQRAKKKSRAFVKLGWLGKKATWLLKAFGWVLVPVAMSNHNIGPNVLRPQLTVKMLAYLFGVVFLTSFPLAASKDTTDWLGLSYDAFIPTDFTTSST